MVEGNVGVLATVATVATCSIPEAGTRSPSVFGFFEGYILIVDSRVHWLLSKNESEGRSEVVDKHRRCDRHHAYCRMLSSVKVHRRSGHQVTIVSTNIRSQSFRRKRKSFQEQDSE